jgi:hypothetical protein
MQNYRKDFDRALYSRHTNPEVAVQEMSKARDAGKQAGDDKFVLFANHWILQTLIGTIRTYNGTLQLAIETAVEARKPHYQDMQEHICVYQDLILSYMGIDPLGNATQIEDAINYMSAEITSNIQCRACLQGLRCEFEIVSGRLERAENACEQYFSVAGTLGWGKTHHEAFAYMYLCEIAFIRQDWQQLQAYALKGQSKAISRETVAEKILFTAYQALAARKMGNDIHAWHFYYQATTAANDTDVTMHHQYYVVLCEYHEMAGSFEEVLKLVEYELSFLVKRGQYYTEALSRIHQCKLLKKLERPFKQERQAAEAVCMKLKNPQLLLGELAQI